MLFFLIWGFLNARSRRSFLRHGILVSAALALHTISIMLVMVPSLLAMGGLFQNLSSNLALIFVFHASLGGLVEVLGIYFVAVWVLGRASVKSCFGRKGLCRLLLPCELHLLSLASTDTSSSIHLPNESHYAQVVDGVDTEISKLKSLY